MIPRKLQAVCLLVLVSAGSSLASAEAEPMADPLADPQSFPEPNPQFYPGAPAPAPYAPALGGGGGAPYPQSPCEMTNQCCNMADKKCCVGGKRCFNQWVRKCDTDGGQDCQVSVSQKCINEKIKDCRVQQEVVTRHFDAKVCVPKPLRQCWPYQRKECQPAYTKRPTLIEWVNEKLVKERDMPKVECIPYKTQKCENLWRFDNSTIKVPVPKIIQKSQKYCSLVPIKGPDRFIDVPQWYTKWEKRCFEVVVPDCSPLPCQSAGTCPPTQSVCSQTEFATQSVCPYAQNRNGQIGAAAAGQQFPVATNPGGAILPGPGASCQQIRAPVCGSVGGSCSSGGQQCCRQRKERVCKQVPIRLQRKIKQTIPGSISYKRQCDDKFYNMTTTVYQNKMVSRNVTYKECEPISKEECLNYTIPVFTSAQETKKVQVEVNLPDCKWRTVRDEYCHTFPTGDIECKTEKVTKAFKINKIICDQEVVKPYCILVPSLNCRPGAPKCRMVNKQVCQDTCNDSPQCRQCDAFTQGSGFGSCPSSTCGNVPLPPNMGGFGGGEGGVFESGSVVGGEGSYSGGALVGGQGFYEGGYGSVGGEGSYEGGSYTVGGQGVYPGMVGGQGSYGGASVGGQGSYGGMVGGQGAYGGMVGGQGSYGGDYGVGGQGSYGGVVGGYGSSSYPSYNYNYVSRGGPNGEEMASGPNPGEDMAAFEDAGAVEEDAGVVESGAEEEAME